MAQFSEGARVASTMFEAAAFQYSLTAACPCGHGVVFDPHALWWLFRRRGWDERLKVAPRRFRCLRCGRNEPALRLSRTAPTVQLPMPPTGEWKRAVGRFRN